MAEIFKFFNSMETSPGVFDREYVESDFADYFGSLLSTGLLSTEDLPGMLVRVEAGTLNTVVSVGKAMLKGHMYENTTPLTLTHSIPEASLDRIDRVVLRLDVRNQSRFIKAFVKEGTPSATPVAPVLQRDNFIYEISLARITVRKNTVQLLPTDLTDERLQEDLCGIVTWLPKLPTSQFQQQWDAFMAGIEDDGFASAAEFNEHKADGAAHGIGNKATLLTTNKTSIVVALNELFTNANDGKTRVANAVTAKGVAASPADTFSALATKIGQISTGKKVATGTMNSSVSEENRDYAVNNLTFTPSIIIVQANYASPTFTDSAIVGLLELTEPFGVSARLLQDRDAYITVTKSINGFNIRFTLIGNVNHTYLGKFIAIE